jgi:hypothetical protein
MRLTWTVSTILVTGAALALTPAVFAQQSMPKTTKERIEQGKLVTTEKIKGKVALVNGNILVVRLSDGTIRQFNVPSSRKFVIDGKEVGVSDLKVGTTLTATTTTTKTSVTERTRTIGSGKVFWVSGHNVVVTLPNGENRTYTVKDDYKFNVEGKKATVSELRQGMNISAEKIVEEPMTEITSNTVVTGQAPKPVTSAKATR